VKNLILMIGDGMGLAQITSARYLKGRLAVEDMKCMGVSYTHSIQNFVTDSSAGATALASGYLIANGEVGIHSNGRPVKLLGEYAEEAGKWTGLVVTCRVTHATPASMVTHVKSRGSEDDIALQLAQGGVEVIFGGGWDKFLPVRSQKVSEDAPRGPAGTAGLAPGRELFITGRDLLPSTRFLAAENPLLWNGNPYGTRNDSRNLVEEMKKRGYRFIRSPAELSVISSGPPGRVLGLFHSGSMPKASEGRNPSLSAMTLGALEILSHAPKGFFLMVEGSQIDWGGHANDFDYVMNEAADFDTAIDTVRRFLRDAGIEKETLVVVTADHETGGLSLNVHPQLALGLEPKWTTTNHTAAPVPVFSAGPRAEQFCGYQSHEQIGRRLIEAVVGGKVEFAYPTTSAFPAEHPPVRKL
jgi:alkaline phosphatase